MKIDYGIYKSTPDPNTQMAETRKKAADFCFTLVPTHPIEENGFRVFQIMTKSDSCYTLIPTQLKKMDSGFFKSNSNL